MRRRIGPPREVNLRPLVALLAFAFMVSLAVVIGTRMSSDALGVLVGVVAGVAASIPTALLLVAVTRRREERYAQRYDESRAHSPPVIVVTLRRWPRSITELWKI